MQAKCLPVPPTMGIKIVNTKKSESSANIPENYLFSVYQKGTPVIINS